MAQPTDGQFTDTYILTISLPLYEYTDTYILTISLSLYAYKVSVYPAEILRFTFLVIG